ncbi:hypothetical protein PENARI_c021G03789 [Penicillium arizonense]|uniref:CFEM domain-containing protein n=1 Tax=Penicillium arizonense TaxID=1835702 RepID=A0A1F5L8Z1_PENAI|nr:hypothetical protein PENARI_c021G03789 [Penicillium arizonense]OGE49429.1 hypothetical protein PENARI_c021G03789 [Penicillium arizonense]
MRSFLIFSLLGLAASVVAQDVDSTDIPSQCKDICAPVVSLTSTCDKKNNNDDAAEIKCVCNDPRASKNIPDCAACLDKYSKDGKDNDANDIVRQCSFTSTMYDATATSASATSNSSASMTSPSLASGSGNMSVTSMRGTASATGSSTSSNAESSPSTSSAGKSIELASGLFGTALLSLMAFVAL